ncbi:pilus assembly protein TadG [Bradyrhizobium yuanmingense]|uniref:pilus assembly protein TadG-related protein n=1 Tax=Bradyrhizobium yuanmingense TaxID=108015 RepID=UPI000FE301E3|nr:pilus assembly protein TadG-related protein [Bradyrhizobium yuanmingense]TGN88990.1 pilus assembly protein TadG [Bradyrhizobium yuanmingense]
MRSLLRSKRGSAAFATVIALVPLIGVVALGAEAGSWYVTRQHAQNAADAAAYSGALRLACANAGVLCDTSVDYHAKQFAAQNGFCNSGDTAYPGTNCATSLPTGISRAVQIDIGSYSAGAFTTPPAGGGGNAVRALVSQQQPAYLSAVLGLTTVNIPAQAIALVELPSKVCALALGPDPNGGGGALKIAGNVSNNGTGCPIMSDASVQFASTASFTGSGWAVLGVTGCSPASTCADPGVTHNYFMPYANNPLSKLDSQSFNSLTSSGRPNDLACSGTLTPNTPPSSTNLYRNLTCTTGDTVDFSPGTYFFYNGTIRFNGGTITCSACRPWPPAGTGEGVTLVLLGDSSISISGGASVELSAPYTNTFSSDLNGVLIDDQAPSKSSNKVNITGGTVRLGGAMYFPHVDVTWNGATQSTNTTCSQVIAQTLTMGGGGFLSTDGCNPVTVPYTQVVRLVQ